MIRFKATIRELPGGSCVITVPSAFVNNPVLEKGKTYLFSVDQYKPIEDDDE